jgi:hypothetical protein
MTPIRASMRVTWAATCLLLPGWTFGERAVAVAAPTTEAELRQAIDSLRGVRYEGLSEAQKTVLGKKLDKAWDTLLAGGARAKPLVESALDAETRDGGLILDLCGLHLMLTKGASDPKRIADWMKRANPNDNPWGYWKVAQWAASTRSRYCRPIMLQAARLHALDEYIAQHALRVDLPLGLTFLWGSYRDELKPELESIITSKDCAERGNAAFGLGLLRARPDMAAIREMAVQDTCEMARIQAWNALASAGDSKLAQTAQRRLAATPALTKDERWAMIAALTSGLVRGAQAPLEALAHDKDDQIAGDARKGLDESKRESEAFAPLRGKLGTGTDEQHAKLRSALRAATEQGRFEYKAPLEDIVIALRPDDMSLVHQARLSVLRRFSDECLYEFGTLSELMSVLRDADAGAGKPPRP